MSKVKKHPGTPYRIIADPIKAGFVNTCEKEINELAEGINEIGMIDIREIKINHSDNIINNLASINGWNINKK